VLKKIDWATTQKICRQISISTSAYFLQKIDVFFHPALLSTVGHLGEAEVSLNGQPNAFLWPYGYTLGWPFG
jgi:hypothetical protein